MKKIYLLAFVIAGFVIPAQAQHYLGFYLNGASPLNNLKDSGYRNGVGFSFEYLSPSLFSPQARKPFEVRIGAGVEVLWHGSSKKAENLTFSTPNKDLGSVRLENQMFGLYIAPKFIFNIGKVSPYFDVFAAARIFNSYQVNRFNKEVSGYERSSSTPVIQNSAAHYGGSLGVIYNLGKKVAFDARVSYSAGSAIKFIDLGSAQKNEVQNKVDYRTVYSPVSDVLVYRLGIIIRLDDCDCPRTQTKQRNSFNLNPGPLKPAVVTPLPPPPPPINY